MERDWYHTIELESGVVTRGYFDLRPLAAKLLPPSLEGMRCLDVGTFDGFWAIEMAQRGAGEVLAVDILDPRGWDWPVGAEEEAVAAIATRKGAGEGFEIATRARGVAIERRELSVYDLGSAGIGEFDFVYCGSLLLHLRDPVRGVEGVRAVCRGEALFVDAIDPWLTRLHPRRPVASFDGIGRPWWWKPNLQALARVVRSGGMELAEAPRRVALKPGGGFPRGRISVHALRSQQVRAELRNRWFGDPHAVIRARRAAV